MLLSRQNLIASIVKKKLYEDVDQILSISRQGFDVFAHVDFPEVKTMLIDLLEQELKVNSREFLLVDYTKSIETSYQEEQFMPTVIVGEFKPNNGYGFVHFQVRSPDQLIGNVAAAIELILNHYNLDIYIDVFDAKKLARLKQIAKIQGIKALIDAVVQTAYYGGYKGDIATAQSYLDSAGFMTENTSTELNISVENCARKFLSHVLSYGDNAHAFLKSCLSYFVVSKQGHTMTRASQILSVSRTTLQEHMKLASELGVSSFFEGRT